MTIAYWHDEYKTGNPKVDEQHQNLFKIVNNLHDAMLAGHGTDVIKKTLDSLINYTIEHFDTEEMLMLVKQYPYYQEHKQAHEDLKAKVTVLAQRMSHGEMVMNREVLQFLNEWLIHHIKGEDKKMIDYLRTLPQKGKEAENKEANQEIFLRIDQSQKKLQQAKSSLRKKNTTLIFDN